QAPHRPPFGRRHGRGVAVRMSRLDLGRLDPDEWERLQALAARFEEACEGGRAADLADFLLPHGDRLRRVALQELIKTDLEIRGRHPQHIRLEDYLSRFPELGSPASVPPALVYEEYRVRQIYGDRPALDSYRLRFPARFAELQKLLQDNPVQVATPSAAAQT